MSDKARVLDGFTNLSTGMDAGKSKSLILASSVANACNVSFRGSYVHTRPPWTNIPITVPASLTSRWTGIYQGAEFYDGQGVASGWIISRGGLIFFLDSSNFTLKEITVQTPVTVTVDFTVPALNATLNIEVTTQSVFSVGQTIVIDGGQYQVQNLFTNEILAEYLGGSTTGATVKSGDAITDTSGNQLIFYDANQSTDDFVYIFQAEQYGIILAGQESPLIWDGNSLRRAGVNEIPPGILGAYGWGRIWITLPDQRSFVAGNLVGDQSSGTAQAGFRDAILKFTDNNFLNGGGTFTIPVNAGKITTMQFLATQDTSLGVGVLLVGTTNAVFSVNAPVDRTTWQNLSYPIQTVSLIDYGPEGPRNSVSVNGDMWYRSVDGIRAFMVVRRYFGDPGNVPMSHEMDPVLSDDTDDLLFYGSGIYFDNKLLETFSPLRTPNGVQHRGMVSINYDLISDLRQKLPPAWEGVHTGVQILQLTKGRINDVERGFMFVAGPSNLELWEIQRQGLHDSITPIKTYIASWMITRSFSFSSTFQLKKLYMLELYLDDIADEVRMTVKFQPDQYPDWVLWGTLQFCASVTQCQLSATVNGVCQVFKTNARQYAARVLLPQPPEALCNSIPGMPPLNLGYEFALKIEWQGHVQVRHCQLHAKVVDQPMEGYCQAAAACAAFPICGLNYFTYSSYTGDFADNLVPPGQFYPDFPSPYGCVYQLSGLLVGQNYIYLHGSPNDVQLRDGINTYVSGETFAAQNTQVLLSGTCGAPVTAIVQAV
jgi:hypothetical protein